MYSFLLDVLQSVDARNKLLGWGNLVYIEHDSFRIPLEAKYLSSKHCLKFFLIQILVEVVSFDEQIPLVSLLRKWVKAYPDFKFLTINHQNSYFRMVCMWDITSCRYPLETVELGVNFDSIHMVFQVTHMAK